MRRIVVFDRVSADGYFAAPDGNLDWVVPDDELDREGAAGSVNADAMLFGRKTYEMFESFWPSAVDDSPTAPDPHGSGRSEAIRAMGIWLTEATKWVFSRTRAEVTWRHSHLRTAFDPREIEAMKRERGKDILVFGSGSIVSQLAEHGLVDELRLVVCPTLLGEGRSLVRGLARTTRLELLEAKPYASGNVSLRYATRRK